MRKISKKKLLVAGAAAAIVATGGGVALAYWTTGGTGTGSATTGTSSNFEITTQTSGEALTPGGPTDTVAIHVVNKNSGDQQLSALHVTVANDNGSAWSSGTCSADDYLVTDPTFAAQDIAGGDSYDATATIQMKNRTASQDDCKGVTVPLYVQAS